jgi:membrane protein implicated in regulation of membrane protease activity
MCHLILLMPLLMLPVFWLLPLPVAGTLYGLTVALSAWLYYFTWRAMRRPVVTGTEELLHRTGTVIDTANGTIRVRVQSENWSAESMDELRAGDRIKVVGIEGLTLKVRSLDE